MESRTCIVNIGEIFYLMIIYLITLPLGLFLYRSNCKCFNNRVLLWINQKIRHLYSYETRVTKGIELLLTMQIILVLSAVVNIAAPPEELSKPDTFSYVFSVVILLGYAVFILIVS